MHTVLTSIATANPPFELSRAQALAFMSNLTGISPRLRDRAGQIYTKSNIDQRYTCISDYLTTPENFSFYPQNWDLTPAPGTAARNQLYQTYAPKIAESAAVEAIAQADLAPDQVTHLIMVSCTGFFAPGIDVALMQQLGLRSDVDRTMIGFMGCYAAFNGLKAAHAICQSNAQAKVLLVCVELCTLHFQVEDSLESVVINALFGDGAAAAILQPQSTADAAGQLAYVDGCSWLLPETTDLMSWTIGNTGFLMELAAQVPSAIAQHLPDYLTQFLQRHDLKPESIDFWAIHPGGRQIVDRIKALLELDDPQVQDSYDVLRDYGNMSSCTILFVLERLLRKQQQALVAGDAPGFDQGVAMAFGPGLTIEGCLFRQVGTCVD